MKWNENGREKHEYTLINKNKCMYVCNEATGIYTKPHLKYILNCLWS